MSRRAVWLLCAGLAACGGQAKEAAPPPADAVLGAVDADSLWLPDSIVAATRGAADSAEPGPSVMYLHNRHRLVLPLYAVSVLGTLPRADQPPLLVLRGAPCADCDVDTAMYFVPGDADTVRGEVRSFVYPGSLRPPASGSDDTTPNFRARVFLGACLDPQRREVVWFQSRRDSTRQWRQDVFHVVVSGDSAMGEFVLPRPPIDSVLGMVQAGHCRELPGLDQLKI